MKILNTVNVLFLSIVVVSSLAIGFMVENLKVLFYKIKEYEFDCQPQKRLSKNFKTHSRLAY
jgi:hypothetical protein